MPSLRSDDAEIFYEIRGNGPPVVLLHPVPCDHEFWNPVAAALESPWEQPEAVGTVLRQFLDDVALK